MPPHQDAFGLPPTANPTANPTSNHCPSHYEPKRQPHRQHDREPHRQPHRQPRHCLLGSACVSVQQLRHPARHLAGLPRTRSRRRSPTRATCLQASVVHRRTGWRLTTLPGRFALDVQRVSQCHFSRALNLRFLVGTPSVTPLVFGFLWGVPLLGAAVALFWRTRGPVGEAAAAAATNDMPPWRAL